MVVFGKASWLVPDYGEDDLGTVPRCRFVHAGRQDEEWWRCLLIIYFDACVSYLCTDFIVFAADTVFLPTTLTSITSSELFVCGRVALPTSEAMLIVSAS